MHYLAKRTAPFVLQGYRGDFNFTRITHKDGNAIRVSPHRRPKKDELDIQFGYTLHENGFDLKLQPVQEVIFIISARLSDKTKKPARLVIQDKAET